MANALELALQSVRVVMVMVGVWACGCSAHTNIDTGFVRQEMTPRESKTCDDIRYNVEQMLYTTYKATIPPRMLKEVLPGLVEPLLPLACVQSGSGGKLLHETLQPITTNTGTTTNTRTTSKAETTPVVQRSTTSATSSRPRRQAGRFRGMKDPGDQPPPGMMRNPMKDPGDRREERMMSPGPAFRQSYNQPFRGGFYGDALPAYGRKKRAAAAANSVSDHSPHHARTKRANGEEEKKGLGLDHLQLPAFPLFFMPRPFMPPFFRSANHVFNNNGGVPRQNRLYSPNGQLFGDAPTYRRAPVNRQAPVNHNGNNGYGNNGNGGNGNGNNGRGPATRARSTGPVLSMSPFNSPVAPSSMVPSQPRSGTRYGDAVPTYSLRSAPRGAAPARRVKRASEDSSSDPSASDVVTFGDVSIPADTFNNMMDPRRSSRSDDLPPPPPPRTMYRQPYLPPPPAYYYPPPPHQQYFPPHSLLHQPGRTNNNVLLARQRALAARRRAAYQRSFPRTRAALYSARAAPFRQPMAAPLPMGAAQPLIYGTRPAY